MNCLGAFPGPTSFCASEETLRPAGGRHWQAHHHPTLSGQAGRAQLHACEQYLGNMDFHQGRARSTAKMLSNSRSRHPSPEVGCRTKTLFSAEADFRAPLLWSPCYSRPNRNLEHGARSHRAEVTQSIVVDIQFPPGTEALKSDPDLPAHCGKGTRRAKMSDVGNARPATLASPCAEESAEWDRRDLPDSSGLFSMARLRTTTC